MGRENPLVLRREVLRVGPGRPLHREHQLREIRSCVRVGRSFHPAHAWISGPPGSGKTVCTRHVLDPLVASAGLRLAWVDCTAAFTFLSVIERILDAVRRLRPVARIREVQLAALRSVFQDTPSAIVLDDVDMLPASDMADVLRHVTALPCTAVFCIATGVESLRRIPEATRSRFTPRLISFPSYRPHQIRDILVATLESALRPASWSDALLNKIVDRAHGDARRMLGLVQHAVARAEELGHQELDAYHLRVVNSIDFSGSEAPLAALTPHHQLLVDVVRRQGRIATTPLEAAFRDTCQRHGMEPIARRTLVKYLGLLCQRRLLERDRSPATKGFVYRLAEQDTDRGH